MNQIEQIVKPSKLYQIILEEKNSNFFTDHFLVYSGEKIPNNFKRSPIEIEEKSDRSNRHLKDMFVNLGISALSKALK